VLEERLPERAAMEVLLRERVLFPEDLLLFRRVLALVGRPEEGGALLEHASRVLRRLEAAFSREEVGEAARALWPVLAYVYHAARGDEEEARLLAHRVARGGALPSA